MFLLAICCLAIFGTVDTFGGAAWISADGYNFSVYCRPDGSGDPLSDCYDWYGNNTDGTIYVKVQEGPDWNDPPIAGIPPEHVRLYIGPWGYAGPLFWHTSLLCTEGWPVGENPYICADDVTDAAGVTTFSGPICLAGNTEEHSDWFFVEVYIEAEDRWVKAEMRDHFHFGMSFRSPNLNYSTDTIVNLTDVILFAGMYYNSVYDAMIDFDNDGNEDLTDIVLLQTANTTSCQNCPCP